MGLCGSVYNINREKRNIKMYRINEVKIEGSNLNEIDKNIFDVSPSICKIILPKLKGSGFLIKIKKWNGEELYFLMTCEHVITKEIVKSKTNVKILYDYELKEINIELDKNKRFIKYFTEMDIDIIIIQILSEDNIDEKYFLSPYMGNISSFLEGNSIFIMQFPLGGNLGYSRGKITRIEDYQLTYNASTEFGSSGSPIFLKNSTEVIGIHKQGNSKDEENYGNFLYPIIEIIKSNNKTEYKEIEDIVKYKKENNEKYIYKNGEYYIGEWQNGQRHGKGALYYKNDKIKYEGDFIKNKFEGDGKYIWEDGEYYIGQFLDGLKEGKGILYYASGKIKYEGDFIKDKFEGNGKYFYENGEYYIGHFLNGQRHGKGTLYYKNKKVKYEGDFNEDKQEGNGKFIWEDGEYYIGQFLNCRSNGKGIEYYKNGKIKYEGDFIKDKHSGYGKYTWEDGEYYIGQYFKGKRQGKGTLYYKNGHIKYEGDFIKDKFEGKGIYYFENGDYYIGEWINDQRNGKGTLYYKNGNIKYEGDFINGEYKKPN